MNTEEAKAKLTGTMARFMDLSSKVLPDDVYARLAELRAAEDSALQKVLYDTYFENLRQAALLDRPCCQDTGLLHFYVRVGSAFPFLGLVAPCLEQAVKTATASIPLRPSTVDYFEELNTETGLGERIPWINWEIIPDNDELEITQYFAGGGCCLPGTARVFTPAQGYEAVVRFVFDTLVESALNACPPLIVGIGLGENVENAAVLSKKAYLRPLGTSHPHPKGAAMEKLILDGLNQLGIGAQGLAGNSLAMAVHVESSGRHTATIAAAVNAACYAHRRGIIRFSRDLEPQILSHRGCVL